MRQRPRPAKLAKGESLGSVQQRTLNVWIEYGLVFTNSEAVAAFPRSTPRPKEPENAQLSSPTVGSCFVAGAGVYEGCDTTQELGPRTTKHFLQQATVCCRYGRAPAKTT